jgi:hypothetical protein
MSDQQPPELTEEQLREQLSRVRVQDLLVQTVVSVINLAAAKADDREQLRLGIEAARALLPLVENELGPDAATFRDAISQLQMEYARGGAATAQDAQASTQQQAPPEQQQPKPGDPGPAQSSGRLWVPGQ